MSGNPVPYGDLGCAYSHRGGGSKISKKAAQKKLKREKVKINVPNLQTRSVFWMVVESIHDIRGISPYGDLGGTFGLGGGVKLQNWR